MTSSMYQTTVLTPTPATGDGNAVAFEANPVPVSRTRGGALETELYAVAGTTSAPTRGAALTGAGMVTPNVSTGLAEWYGPDGYTGAMWAQDPVTLAWTEVLPVGMTDRAGGVSSVTQDGGTPQTGAAVITSPTWDTLANKPAVIAAGPDAATARSAIGAVTIGTTSGTAKAGDWKPAASDITDSTATGQALVKAADAPTALGLLGGLGTDDVPPIDLSAGDVGYQLVVDETGTGIGTAPQPPYVDPTLIIRGATLNPGQPVPANWPNGGIAFVRTVAPSVGAVPLGKAGSGTSTTSVSVTLSDAVAVGEDILVSVAASAAGSVLSSFTITDASSSGGSPNNYVNRGQRLQGSGIQCQVFKARPVTSLAAGTVLTVTAAASVGDLEVIVTKMTGLAAPSSDVLGQNSAFSVTSLPVSGGGATQQANELATLTVAFVGSGNSVVDPASWAQAGWTQIDGTQTMTSTNPKYVAVFARTLTAIETPSVTPQITNASAMIGLLVTHMASF